MSDEDQNATEREIMMVMRKVLTQIIKDITPPDRETPHPLSPRTIDDVKICLRMIASRERELAELAGEPMQKPYYNDEKPKAEVVPIDAIGGLSGKKDEGE